MYMCQPQITHPSTSTATCVRVQWQHGNKPPTSTCWLARLLYRSCQCITRTTCTKTRACQPQTVTTVRVGRTAGCLAGRYLVATCWVHDGSEHSCSYMHSRDTHVHVHVATRICTCIHTYESDHTAGCSHLAICAFRCSHCISTQPHFE